MSDSPNEDLKAKMREALDRKQANDRDVVAKASRSRRRRTGPRWSAALRRCTGARPVAEGPDAWPWAVRPREVTPRGTGLPSYLLIGQDEALPRRPSGSPTSIARSARAVRSQLRGVRGRCDVQALARQDGHRVRRPPVLPAHDEPPPAAPRRELRRGDHAVRQERRGRQLRLLDPARHVACPTSPARRSPTSRSSRCATSRRPSTGTRSTARPPVLDKWESKSKDDRGVVHVETIGYNQDGKVVCIFRRKVMVPKDSSPTRTGPGPRADLPPGVLCSYSRTSHPEAMLRSVSDVVTVAGHD